MKRMALAAIVIALSLAIGGCATPASRCQCPPEQMLLNTEAGLLHFEPGELDQDQTYILRGDQVEEFKRQIEREQLKQTGKGA